MFSISASCCLCVSMLQSGYFLISCIITPIAKKYAPNWLIPEWLKHLCNSFIVAAVNWIFDDLKVPWLFPKICIYHQADDLCVVSLWLHGMAACTVTRRESRHLWGLSVNTPPARRAPAFPGPQRTTSVPSTRGSSGARRESPTSPVRHAACFLLQEEGAERGNAKGRCGSEWLTCALWTIWILKSGFKERRRWLWN